MADEREEGTSADSETGTAEKGRRSREQRPFPASSFEEALELALAIQRFSSGKPIRRLTLFDQLGKSPESGASRQLITNSARYGLTVGSKMSETIELTPDGTIATSEDAPARERARAKVKLAITEIPIFKGLYERFVGNKLPAKQVWVDAAKDLGVSAEHADEAVETLIVNLKFVGLLRMLSGAERIVTLDHLLDALPASADRYHSEPGIESPSAAESIGTNSAGSDFDSVCFYVTPIGDDGSPERKHSDLFLGSIVEPALEPFNLTVIRADKIDKPGMITRQIMDYLVRARLVIADLSFHNPNVFYELAIRHAMRLPTVQIIRKNDRIPFDVNQARTIEIDSTDLYTFVPQMETYRAAISGQVRRALQDPDLADNPVSLFYPNLRATLRVGTA